MAIKLVPPMPEPKGKPTYPYFGRLHNGTIVLFTAERTGVCIVACGRSTIGRYDDTWFEDQFTPIEGPITFENVFEK